MAVREFNGTSDYIQLDSGLVSDFNRPTTGSGMSTLLVVKPTTIGGGDKGFMSAVKGDATLSLFATYDHGAGDLSWGSDDPGADAHCSVGLSSGGWLVIGITKAKDTAVPRGHRKVLGSGSWTHTSATGGATVGSSVEVCGSFFMGKFSSGGGGFKDYRLAFAAFFEYVLSDADYAAIESAASTQNVYDNYSPTILWDFNQDLVATPVIDLTGSGGDQVAISGTTVVTGDNPVWEFGLTAPTPNWTSGVEGAAVSTDFTFGGGSATKVSSPVNSGTGAMQINAASEYQAKDLTDGGSGSVVHHYTRLYFQVNTLPGSNAMVLQHGSTGGPDYWNLMLTSTGTLQAQNPTPANIGSASSALSLDTWYVIETRWIVNNVGNDEVEARVYPASGSPGASFVNDSTARWSGGTGGRVKFGNNSGTGGLITYYDDMALYQSASSTDWIGPLAAVGGGSEASPAYAPIRPAVRIPRW